MNLEISEIVRQHLKQDLGPTLAAVKVYGQHSRPEVPNVWTEFDDNDAESMFDVPGVANVPSLLILTEVESSIRLERKSPAIKSRCRLLIVFLWPEMNRVRAKVTASYVLRAVIRSMRNLINNGSQEARTENDIRLIDSARGMQQVLDGGMNGSMWGFVDLDILVQDMNP